MLHTVGYALLNDHQVSPEVAALEEATVVTYPYFLHKKLTDASVSGGF
jgi:hypothetical protein